MEQLVDFGEKMKGIADKYRLSIGGFGEAIGVGRGIYGYTHRKSTPSAEIIINILRAFPDVNPDWLLLNEGAMIRSTPKEKPSETLPDTALTIKYLKAIEELSQCRKELIDCLKGHPEGLPPIRPRERISG